MIGAFGLYINGAWTKPANTVATINPATGEKIADVSSATAADMNSAVAAARAALPGWQALTGHQRARYLYALARQVLKHSRRLAVLESMDNGKPIRESRDIDIPLVARHFYAHAGWAQLLETEFPGYTACGVVGQIIPWNFPLLMFAWKVAPALAAGNTVVIKPANYTPLTALAFAELAQEVGLPAGVLNVVTCDRRVGTVLVEHPDVDKIAFTGSTDAGRVIRKASANSPKKLSLELGGKSPFIVFDDADLDSAVEGPGGCDLVQPGAGVLRRIAAAGARARGGATVREDPHAAGESAGWIAAGQGGGHGSHRRPAPTQADYGLCGQGDRGGRDLLAAQLFAAREGPLLPANAADERADLVDRGAGGDLWAGAGGHDLPHAGGGGRTREQHGLWACFHASISENINVALDVASQIKAGVCWVNCANMFDASLRLWRLPRIRVRPRRWTRRHVRIPGAELAAPRQGQEDRPCRPGRRSCGRGGRLRRRRLQLTAPSSSTSAASRRVPIAGTATRSTRSNGKLVGEAPLGNRKDIRNAVEAARAAGKWAKQSAHNRAQVLYYIAENMIQRRDELAAKLAVLVGEDQAGIEVDYSIERIFAYAGWADKFEGVVHNPPGRNVTLAMNEPVGTIGILAPEESPLLGLLSLVLPAIAMGNTVVAVPSERYATVMADLYSILDTSDLPGGVVNIVAGRAAEIGKTLAEHDDVDAVWSFRDEAASTMVKLASVGNMKQTWTNDGYATDWYDPQQAEGRYFLRHATQVKNIWVPYGE